MDSGDEAALDDIDTGEEGEIIPDVLEVDNDTYAPDATELVIAHEIRFAEQFLEKIGGEQAVLAGANPDALRYGESPIALFFHFMPVPHWQHIAI
ncbi:hypothetical protein JG687_00017249 [Phytophthora cactorum]|uniref:Uncharacterized protein n=1 Tax=Phytophthora cactorum TaxID=29920 RepID=A0A8T1TSZ6_9STRA|nr:hypothetical protein JG687_00017249 [Phytophthora cactorum]